MSRCCDCGGRFHPVAMDFHHLDPSTKAGVIATMANDGAFLRLKQEIRKCVILCANCHRVRENA